MQWAGQILFLPEGLEGGGKATMSPLCQRGKDKGCIYSPTRVEKKRKRKTRGSYETETKQASKESVLEKIYGASVFVVVADKARTRPLTLVAESR